MQVGWGGAAVRDGLSAEPQVSEQAPSTARPGGEGARVRSPGSSGAQTTAMG